jgi:hypothetical protein
VSHTHLEFMHSPNSEQSIEDEHFRLEAAQCLLEMRIQIR